MALSVLLQGFWQILLLRRSPQILPCSPQLLSVVLLCHLLVGTLLAAFTSPLSDAFISAALGTLLLAGFSHLLLAFYGVVQRSVQVITALAGAEVVIGLLSLPLDFWYSSVSKADAGFPVMLSLVLFGWNIAVAAYIYRHALEVSRLLSFLLAIVYISLSLTLALLIGAPEG